MVKLKLVWDGQDWFGNIRVSLGLSGFVWEYQGRFGIIMVGLGLSELV